MTDSKSTSNSCSKKHVALVAGGMSSERDISLISAENVSKALTNAGYRVTFIDMDVDIAIHLSTLKPDVVFNCLHGTFGEDGCLPGLLNIMRLPYTHSGVLASSLAFDKIKAKQWFRLTGVTTAEGVVVHKHEVTSNTGDPMDRPYVIKPRGQGSSIGVEAIFEGDDFDFGTYTFPYGDQVLVERFIKGREFTVAVLNGIALGAKEVFTPKSKRIHDHEVKYSKEFAKLAGPPPPLPSIPDDLNAKLLASAEKIFQSFECRGPARMDFMLEEKTDLFYVLEVNTHPGLKPTSYFTEIAATCKGMNLEYIVDAIVECAACDTE